MIQFPTLDPVAFYIGSFAIYWYGLMYLIAFMLISWLADLRVRWQAIAITREQCSDLMFYAMLGVVLGGRIGYTLIYNSAEFISNPLVLLQLRAGGMSFHGGLVGALLAFYYFARRQRLYFFAVADFIAPMIPIGLGLGRIGNFINAELWGRVTTVPWAMVFPGAGPLPRHPSQLYEAMLEGVVLFLCLWLYVLTKPPRAAVSGLFLVLYGAFRFLAEFFREPDLQMGIYWQLFSMGQLLSLPLVLFGSVILVYAYRQKY